MAFIVPSSPFNFVEIFAVDGEPLVRFFFGAGIVFFEAVAFAVAFFATMLP